MLYSHLLYVNLSLELREAAAGVSIHPLADTSGDLHSQHSIPDCPIVDVTDVEVKNRVKNSSLPIEVENYVLVSIRPIDGKTFIAD
jgi:hypothetical protein